MIPDCVTTCEPAAPRLSFSVLHSLFSLSHLMPVPLALARPRPRSPSPSLALALVHSCLHRSPSPLSVLVLAAHSRPHHSSPLSPSAIVAASSRQCANARRQHTGIYASPSPHLRVLESSGSRPLSLSLSLCHLGHIPELSMQAPFYITAVWVVMNVSVRRMKCPSSGVSNTS